VIQAEPPAEDFALDHRGSEVIPVSGVRRRAIDAFSCVLGGTPKELKVLKLLSQLLIGQSGYQFDGESALACKVVDRCHGHHYSAKDSVSYA